MGDEREGEDGGDEGVEEGGMERKRMDLSAARSYRGWGGKGVGLIWRKGDGGGKGGRR